MEIIRFNDQSKQFDFYTANFKKFAQSAVLRPQQSCNRCHLGRPIWDAYPVWPGMYGSHGHDMARTWDRPEAKELLKSAGADDSRLKSIPLENHYSLSHNNTLLGLRLGQIRREVLHGTMKAHPKYPELRMAMLAAWIDAPDFLSYLPENKGQNARRRYTELLVETRKAMLRYQNKTFTRQLVLGGEVESHRGENQAYLRRLEHRKPLFRRQEILSSSTSMAKTRLALESYGIDPGKLDFTKEKSFFSNDGIGGIHALDAVLLKELEESSPNLRGQLKFRSYEAKGIATDFSILRLDHSHSRENLRKILLPEFTRIKNAACVRSTLSAELLKIGR